MKKVIFNGTECVLKNESYSDGNPALTLYEAETGEPYAVASVNLPGQTEKGEIAIKDWSENFGMLDVMIEAGVVSKPVRYVWSGYVKIPICKIV